MSGRFVHTHDDSVNRMIALCRVFEREHLLKDFDYMDMSERDIKDEARDTSKMLHAAIMLILNLMPQDKMNEYLAAQVAVKMETLQG